MGEAKQKEINNHAVSRAVTAAYKKGFEAPNIEQDMRYYDMLPWPIKKALDDAPWTISTKATYHYLRTHGVVSCMREIQDSVDQFYAAFEKETGVPRPRKPLGTGQKRKRG
jgi:hypothetical protein